MAANRIRTIRRERGLTLDQLAARLEAPDTGARLNGSTLSKLEIGQRELTPPRAALIAKALGVSPEDLRAGG